MSLPACVAAVYKLTDNELPRMSRMRPSTRIRRSAWNVVGKWAGKRVRRGPAAALAAVGDSHICGWRSVKGGALPSPELAYLQGRATGSRNKAADDGRSTVACFPRAPIVLHVCEQRSQRQVRTNPLHSTGSASADLLRDASSSWFRTQKVLDSLTPYPLGTTGSYVQGMGG